MTITRKIDNLGRVCLPMAIRKELKLYAGSKITVVQDCNKIIIEKYEPTSETEYIDQVKYWECKKCGYQIYHVVGVDGEYLPNCPKCTRRIRKYGK